MMRLAHHYQVKHKRKWRRSSQSLLVQSFCCHLHDDVIKSKRFQRYWPFVRGNRRPQADSPHKGQWRGSLMISLIYAWTNCWVNNQDSQWFETPSRSLWRHCNVFGTKPSTKLMLTNCHWGPLRTHFRYILIKIRLWCFNIYCLVKITCIISPIVLWVSNYMLQYVTNYFFLRYIFLMSTLMTQGTCFLCLQDAWADCDSNS